MDYLGEWTEAERYAARLETYTREQPLDWPDFMIERGRALAAWGGGDHSPELHERVSRLKERAEQIGMASAMPAFTQVFDGVAD